MPIVAKTKVLVTETIVFMAKTNLFETKSIVSDSNSSASVTEKRAGEASAAVYWQFNHQLTSKYYRVSTDPGRRHVQRGFENQGSVRHKHSK
jgi:hypothetical protein